MSEKFGNPTATTVVTSAEGIPAIVTEGGVTKLVDVNGQVVKAAKLDLSVAGAAGDPDAMETTEDRNILLTNGKQIQAISCIIQWPDVTGHFCQKKMIVLRSG